MLYTESDLEAAMDKIQTINFHEEKEVLDDIEDSYVATSSVRLLLIGALFRRGATSTDYL